MADPVYGTGADVRSAAEPPTGSAATAARSASGSDGHTVFEYAVVRVMPRVERGEYVNVGVVLWCRGGEFLAARFHLDPSRLALLDPFLDTDDLAVHLAALARVCEGGPAAGPVGQLGPGERFRWLTAPRSTVLQTSPVHTGLTDDPSAELDRLVEMLAAPPRRPV